MYRPLREPFYLRIWRLVYGLLFYNTVYWRKASDGLNLPTLTPEERERQRPERNLEIIKPRMRPRARLEEEPNATRGAEVYDPEPTSGPDIAEIVEQATIYEDVPHLQGRPHVYRTENEDGTEQVYIKRRRYRRRLVSRGSEIDRGSFLARVFGKK